MLPFIQTNFHGLTNFDKNSDFSYSGELSLRAICLDLTLVVLIDISKFVAIVKNVK